MLKFRPGVGVFITIVILTAVGVVIVFSRTTESSSYEEYLQATAPPLPNDVFVGEQIVPPIPAPEFDLIAQTGDRVTNQDLEGKIVLISFAYTSCPDTCPVMFGRYLKIQEELSKQMGDQVVLAFITVDPRVDTPERLQEHTAAIKGDWLFLTEKISLMVDVWDEFGVFVEKDGALVSHTNITYLLDPQGLVRVQYIGMPPESVFLADIQKLLTEF